MLIGLAIADGRRLEQHGDHQAQIWKIPINWPGGEIEFEARGFTQRAEGEPLVTSSQMLTLEQRNRVRESS